jgi:cysteine desulfurase
VRTVYLDYNATTPLDENVRAAMMPFLDVVYGNPSSVHHVGQRARAALDDSRDRVAAVLGCLPSEIIFTSGATESCNHALIGAAWLRRDSGRHIVTSAIEHNAVLHTCEYLANNLGFELSVVSPDSTGLVAAEAVFEAIRPDTILVSLMAANNEVGTIQPVAEVGEHCAHNDILFHCDAVQSLGKLPFSGISQFRADLVSLCAHKLHGPKGAGLLFVRSPLQLPPLLHGGAHELDRRAGTENLPAIIGMTEALERFVSDPVFSPPSLLPLASRVIELIDASDVASFRGHRDLRLPNTVAFSVAGADSIALLSALDLEGICASSGSACSSGSITPSHVLSAMGVPSSEANSLVRLSLGRESSGADIDSLAGALSSVLRLFSSPQQPSSKL